MAGFRTHITVSTVCGIVYGAAIKPMGFDPATAFLAAGVTGVGGMLPDLDSDSGIPVREMTGLAAAVLPMLLIPRMTNAGVGHEAMIATVVLLYFVIRYLGAYLLRASSVHRGMFHSIPAMAIAGLVVYLAYDSPNVKIRLALAGGVMIGFLSHLVLDEIYSVDFNGVRVRLNSFAGSAVKFVSPSWFGTCVCYLILGGLGWLAFKDSQQYLK